MPEFNERKFKELILYLANLFKEEKFFGSTKLNKLLFFCDFLAYERLERPITGAEYIAIEYGPVPRRFLAVQEDMLEDGDIVIERKGYQSRILPTRSPDLSQFSKKELEIVGHVAQALKLTTAEEVSDLAHQLPGWREARSQGLQKGENIVIPYGAGPVSALLAAASLMKDSQYLDITRRGLEEVAYGKFSRLSDVKRRLGDV